MAEVQGLDGVVVTLIHETNDSTLSKLTYKDFVCFVIEDGKREVKVKGETCIPALTSRLVGRRYGGFYERYRARYGHEFALEIEDVPGFRDILIHIGNTINDTSGCLLLNYGARLVGDNWVGIDSASAYLDFYAAVYMGIKQNGYVPIKIIRYG